MLRVAEWFLINLLFYFGQVSGSFSLYLLLLLVSLSLHWQWQVRIRTLQDRIQTDVLPCSAVGGCGEKLFELTQR